jgi:hypothetical protein
MQFSELSEGVDKGVGAKGTPLSHARAQPYLSPSPYRERGERGVLGGPPAKVVRLRASGWGFALRPRRTP